MMWWIAVALAGPTQDLDEAWRRIDIADFEGARALASHVARTTPELEEEATYVIGVSHDLAEEPEQAIAVFARWTEGWEDGERKQDALYRLAHAYGTTDQPKAALTTLKALGPSRRLPGDSAARVEMSRAMWTWSSGKHRAGTKRVQRRLDDPGLNSWHVAMGHFTLQREYVRQAEKTEFKGSRNALRRQLKKRASAIKQANEHLFLVVGQAEHGVSLDAMRLQGTALESFGSVILGAKEPKLSPEQLEIYRDEIRQVVEQQWVNALDVYEIGLKHVRRVGWTGEAAQQLEADRTRIMARIESLNP